MGLLIRKQRPSQHIPAQAPAQPMSGLIRSQHVSPSLQPNVEPTPPFLSLREAAEWLCVSKSTLQRLLTKGDLVAIRIGGRRKIPASSLAAYVGRDILIPKSTSETSSPDLP